MQKYNCFTDLFIVHVATVYMQSKCTWYNSIRSAVTGNIFGTDYSIPDDIKDVCCDLYTIQLNDDGCTHNNECHGFSIDFPPGVLLTILELCR